MTDLLIIVALVVFLWKQETDAKRIERLVLSHLTHIAANQVRLEGRIDAVVDSIDDLWEVVDGGGPDDDPDDGEVPGVITETTEAITRVQVTDNLGFGERPDVVVPFKRTAMGIR